MKTKQTGFSLIELVVVMGIMSVVMAATYSILYSQMNLYSKQSEIADVTQVSRSTLESMVRDIRSVGYKQYGSSFNGIQTATSTRIRVLADFGKDGTTSGTDEDITYAYDPDAHTLSRNNDIIADNVMSFNLVYTMADGSTTSTPSDLSLVRKISVSLTIQSPHPKRSGGYETLPLSTEIKIRNI